MVRSSSTVRMRKSASEAECRTRGNTPLGFYPRELVPNSHDIFLPPPVQPDKLVGMIVQSHVSVVGWRFVVGTNDIAVSSFSVHIEQL